MRPQHDPPPAAALAERYALVRGLARRYYPGLTDHDIEDVVQETLVRVLERMRRSSLDDPVSYAARVVYTTGAEVLRDRRRGTAPVDPTTGVLDAGDVYGDRSAAPLTPEEEVLAHDDTTGIRRVLHEELEHDERRALTLRLVCEREPAEIAAELGVSVRRYRALRERGLRKLAAGMARSTDATPASVAALVTAAAA